MGGVFRLKKVELFTENKMHSKDKNISRLLLTEEGVKKVNREKNLSFSSSGKQFLRFHQSEWYSKSCKRECVSLFVVPHLLSEPSAFPPPNHPERVNSLNSSDASVPLFNSSNGKNLHFPKRSQSS